MGNGVIEVQNSEPQVPSLVHYTLQGLSLIINFRLGEYAKGLLSIIDREAGNSQTYTGFDSRRIDYNDRKSNKQVIRE